MRNELISVPQKQRNALINGPVYRDMTVQVLQQPSAISQSGTVAQTNRPTPEVSFARDRLRIRITLWTLCYIFTGSTIYLQSQKVVVTPATLWQLPVSLLRMRMALKCVQWAFGAVTRWVKSGPPGPIFACEIWTALAKSGPGIQKPAAVGK